jgi:hypothetical protein
MKKNLRKTSTCQLSDLKFNNNKKVRKSRLIDLLKRRLKFSHFLYLKVCKELDKKGTSISMRKARSINWLTMQLSNK